MFPRIAITAAVCAACASSAVSTFAAPVAAPAPAAAPASPAVAPNIDPQAIKLLSQMVTAETAQNSFTATIEIQNQGQASEAVVKVEKPDMAYTKVTMQGKTSAEAVANSSGLTLADFGQKKYIVQKMAGAQAVTGVLQQSQSIAIALISDPSQILGLVKDPHTESVAFGPTGTAAGVPTQSVVAVLDVAPNTAETITFTVGTDDYLLRGLAFSVAVPAAGGQPAKTITHTETFTSFSAAPGLTKADFQFTPPAGLVKVASVDDMQPPTWSPKLKVGGLPFVVTATDLSGKPISIAQYKGKVLMLDFWATWCGPCRAEMPNVVAAYKKYHSQGFDVVGVSLDQANDAAALKAFLVQNHMPWPQIYDGGYWQSKVAVEYGVQAIPFNVLIGKDGKIAALDSRGPALAPAIQAALAKK